MSTEQESKPRIQMEASADYRYLNVLLTTQLLVASVESLKGTNWYKQELKHKGNTFLKEMQLILREDLPLICDIDDQKIYLLMNYIEDMIIELASVRAEEIGVRQQIMKMYRENPEDVLAALKLKLVDTIPKTEDDA